MATWTEVYTSRIATARASDANWVKASHDLLKYLLECGECTANCAEVAERALLSTGWERTAKISDVANTVHYIVTDKWTCTSKTGALAGDWVMTYLNQHLRMYNADPSAEPEPVVLQPGVVADIITPPGEEPKALITTVGEGESCKGLLTQCKGGLSCLNGVCVKTTDVPPISWPDLPGLPGKDPEPEPGATGECPKGAKYQAPIFGNCDTGYYREKRWGRDMCICEEGQFAATPWSKLADYLGGNIKMILIAMVIIVIGVMGVKLASKKVSVG